MAFIKCPQCGQTALSIASVCPKCGHLLMQHAPPQGGDEALVRCPRCEKFIDRNAERCEFCAFPQVFWRRARRAALGVLGVAALVAGAVGIRSLTAPRAAPQPTRPAVIVPPPPPVTTEVDSTPITVAPIVVDAVQPPDEAAPSQPPPPPAPVTDTVPTVDRWVITWANLREGPSLDSPVIRILLPGTLVRTARPARGFSAVYGPEGLEGYVAISLLSDRQLPRDSLARIVVPQ